MKELIMNKTLSAKELTALANEAHAASYCPYSGLSVGAALLTEGGKVYLGANIENSAFWPTVCAERVALFKAVNDGERKFKDIAVVGGRDGTAPERFFTPCGVCRQVLSEFCDKELKIFVFDGKETREYTLGELLPAGFSNEAFGGEI